MKLSRNMILNYLVDSLGYNEDEGKEMISAYTLKELLTPEQLKDCIAFNS